MFISSFVFRDAAYKHKKTHALVLMSAASKNQPLHSNFFRSDP